jgi:hypothetical protein
LWVSYAYLCGRCWINHLNTTHFHVLFAHFAWWIQLNQCLETTMTAAPNAAVLMAFPLVATGNTPAINRIVPSFNRSLVTASVLNKSPKNCQTTDPSHKDDNDSFTDCPLPFHPRSVSLPSASTITASRPSSHPSHPTLPTKGEKILGHTNLRLFNRRLTSDFINEPPDHRPSIILPYTTFLRWFGSALMYSTWQSVVHYTSPYCQWQISRAAYTTSILQCGVTLTTSILWLLVPFHELRSD